jgi:hypothetical protein
MGFQTVRDRDVLFTIDAKNESKGDMIYGTGKRCYSRLFES